LILESFALIYEIGDAEEYKAISYLMQNGFSYDKTKKLFGCVGGN